MRIQQIELFRLKIPLKQAFGHAAHLRHHAEPLLVRLDFENHSGWGEFQPRPYVTGESIDQIWSDPEPFLTLLNQDFENRTHLLHYLQRRLDAAGRRLALQCGLELALLDLFGQLWSFAAADILGPILGPVPPAGVVIGFEIETAALKKHCTLLRFGKRTHVKLKVGHPEDDVRLQVAHQVLQQPLRLDANGAWSTHEAIDHLRRLAALAPIVSIEQPIAASDPDALRQIRAAAGVPLMIDEGLCSLADAQTLLAADAIDIFNLRLAKCGGFLGTQRLAKLAQDSGRSLHLGTMVGETGLLSAASEAFACRTPGIFYLEGRGQNKHLLVEDVFTPVAQDAPGLGVHIAAESLTKYASDRRSFRPK